MSEPIFRFKHTAEMLHYIREAVSECIGDYPQVLDEVYGHEINIKFADGEIVIGMKTLDGVEVDTNG